MVFRHFFSKPAVAEATPDETRAKQQAGAVVVNDVVIPGDRW